ISRDQQAYVEHYNVDKQLDRKTIKRIMNKFSRDATVEDLPRRGRSKPACTNENLKKMRDSVNENMKTLLKIRSQELCRIAFVDALENHIGNNEKVAVWCELISANILMNFKTGTVCGSELFLNMVILNGYLGHLTYHMYFKDRVYTDQPKTLADFKNNIREKFSKDRSGYIKKS
uniref:Uncharacterized protein n=1 Tax=Strongyloides stercoralis TaxID=6248 RepID=A0AAF5CZ22_STRER